MIARMPHGMAMYQIQKNKEMIPRTKLATANPEDCAGEGEEKLGFIWDCDTDRSLQRSE
jgi:hypothetical protein